MRVAVLGAGGVGGFFGARLAQAGEDVTFIARGEHLAAIRAHGLHVDSIQGDFEISSAQATDDPLQVGPVDVVLLGVKAWQVLEVIPALRPLIGPETVIIPLQNGVEAPTQLAKTISAEHVVGGLAKIISLVVGPGHIRHVGAEPFIAIGELDNQLRERTKRVQDMLQRAGIKTNIAPDIQSALWEKFLFVVSWGGVGAVADAPIGVLRQVPQTREMLEQCMREIQSVARERTINMDDEVIQKTMAFIDTLPPGGTTSLQRDIKADVPSELEFWNGAVVRFGNEAGVATPLNTFIYNSLLPRELRARGEFEVNI